MSVISVNGGTKDNVIPGLCRMQIVTTEPEKIKTLAEEMFETWKGEFVHDEPNLYVNTAIGAQGTYQAMTEETQLKVLTFLINCPNAVDEFSRSLEGMVETSDNLGVVATEEDSITFKFLTRSGVATKLVEFKEKLISWCELLGAAYEISGEYPAWMFKEESKIRPVTADAYERVFGIRPEITTIHAGLECGLLSGKKPDLDCISFGPQMYDIHTYNERLSIESTQKTWEVLKEILKQCK